MSNRISNLICPQSNCCPHTPHPQSPATQIYSFCSLYLRKWQFHLSSCSVKENSWSLFSFSVNKYYKDLPSGFIQDLTTALPSFTDSTLECEGQAYNPLPGRPGNLSHVPPGVFPWLRARIDGDLVSHRMKMARSPSAWISEDRAPVDLKYPPYHFRVKF